MRTARYWMPWLFAGIAMLLGFAAEHTIERFQREMVAIGRLDHPNIVRALDAGEGPRRGPRRGPASCSR